MHTSTVTKTLSSQISTFKGNALVTLGASFMAVAIIICGIFTVKWFEVDHRCEVAYLRQIIPLKMQTVL